MLVRVIGLWMALQAEAGDRPKFQTWPRCTAGRPHWPNTRYRRPDLSAGSWQRKGTVAVVGLLLTGIVSTR